MKKENKWESFKTGATDPITLSMASLQFTTWIGLGAGFASIGFWKSHSWGLAIMFTAIAGLQFVGTIREWKQFKFLKDAEKNRSKNKDKFDEIFKKIKEM